MHQNMHQESSASLDRQPIDHALIDVAWYADAAIAALMQRLGALHNQDARLMLKQPDDGLPGEAHQPGDFTHGVRLFLQFSPSVVYPHPTPNQTRHRCALEAASARNGYATRSVGVGGKLQLANAP